ncbi:FAD dependent oxidoreductase [Aspergillus californicus]
MSTPTSSVIIVGAGVFGLSTALWLSRSGYKNVTVYDRQPFDRSFYNPAAGCDSASADINKIFRATYGTKGHSQDLAFEARDIWLQWNKEIRESDPSALPSSLTPEDELLTVCGLYNLADGADMIDFYKTSLDAVERTAPKGFSDLQFIKGNANDEERAKRLAPVWGKKYHLFDHFKDGATNGFLDAASGVTLADKACVYARHLCEKAGVKFVLGRPQGELEQLITVQSGSSKKVTGIRTRDGKSHFADLVVVACGPWTAQVVPEAHRSVEATMGTLMFVDVPEHRKDIREKFHPSNMPIWRFIQGEGDGAYEGGGFPITKAGRLKFGFRARKFTNFEDHPTAKNIRLSTPRTKFSPNPIDTVPLYGLGLMKQVIGGLFPELAEIGFTDSRLCWYTDSIDNEFVIDYVPGYFESLFVCTGGSGHGFKFLPVLGKYVKNQLERKPDRFTPYWRWRGVEAGKTCNGLEEGENGPREMKKLQLAKEHDFKFDSESPAGPPSRIQKAALGQKANPRL